MRPPALTHASAAIFLGDCLDVLAEMPDNSVDSICTDPPYGLGFMGKAWDDLPPGLDWAVECLRVLKPGGHLLAFGGSRTWHRLAVAIEDAGFEMRDSIAWLYGSGFPKSMDVSKAIDKAAGATREVIGLRTYGDGATYSGGAASGRSSGHMGSVVAREPSVETAPATPAAQQWSGWGTALKPAFEPIVVARKPLSGTVAANVLEHGTGALNIDGCRIAGEVPTVPQSRFGGSNNNVRTAGRSGEMSKAHAGGRWPTNVVLDGDAADELDEQSGNRPGRRSQNVFSEKPKFEGGVNLSGSMAAQPGYVEGYNDSGGASRFFPTFRYQAKAPTRERPVVTHDDGSKTSHPTVKPLALMRWLVRLVTPAGGTVLDMFAGSGATIEAAVQEGFYAMGVEREEDYLPLIQIRLDRVAAPEDAA